MASFPTLSIGPVMHPATKTTRFVTEVHQFGDGSEQRWQSAPTGLVDWELVYTAVPSYDLELVRQFFIDQKGMDGITWDITIEAVLYENMTFLTDEFIARENETYPDHYDFTIKTRQLSA